ncbi:MAG: copper homeostasis protein CutC [Bacteroidales bacterium]|jgi:copper homeostasis protein|nr:copper homeostasis protein CutC [Bacteroidales bacterium]
MNHTELEICVFSVASAVSAQKAGADRVELCSGFAEGGLTPSAGTIRMARKLLGIECYVMIRPRGGDFCYSDTEFEQMHNDIEYAKSCGVNGVVLGALQPNGHINIIRTRELVQHAAPLKVTFHRAFDHAVDPFRALDDIVVCGCCRILTSGQKATAAEGIDIIGKLTLYAAGRIDIMAGSGVGPENACKFIEAGVQALHFSAKKIKSGRMMYRNPAVPVMQAGAMSDYDLIVADEEKIRKMTEVIREAARQDKKAFEKKDKALEKKDKTIEAQAKSLEAQTKEIAELKRLLRDQQFE